MALVVKDRVRETSTTTGTGALTLNGAVTGFQSFSVIGDGNTTYYTIVDAGTGAWEVGIGTYTLSTTSLARDTVLESSNSGSLVNFGSNLKDVFVTYPAERSIYTDAAGTAITPATASVLGVASGGTGQSTYTNGQLLIGNTTGNTLTKATLTAGTGISITNGTGSISIAATNNGDVVGPASSTDNAVARFDLTTGKIIQNSGVTIDDSNNVSGVAQLNATTVDATNIEVTNIKAKDGTASASIADSTGVFTHATTTVFPAGAVGTPAITTTGDTNTGIYFPAADTIGFVEGGAEAMRIDSNGRVGIGVTPSITDAKLTTVGGPIQLSPGTTSQEGIRLTRASGICQINGINNDNNAYNALTFATGVSEAMRIDTSGNVGVGTSAPSFRFVSLGGRIQLGGGTTAQEGIAIQRFSGYALITGINHNNDAYNALAFSTSASEAMRIDTTNNVGIGTTSPSTFGRFVVQTSSSSNTPIVAITNNALSPQLNHYITDSGSTVRNLNQIGFATGSSNSANYQGFMTFSTMASAGGTISERMRIDASGNVMVGTTSASGQVTIAKSGERCLSLSNTAGGAAANQIIQFIRNGVEVGNINTTNVATAYVTSSDYRLKENVQPIQNALDKVTQLQPCTWTWKNGGNLGQGFIAHELQAVVPDCVTGEKDGEEMQGVDYGKLTPVLTAALQEAIAKIETLEARIAVLEAK